MASVHDVAAYILEKCGSMTAMKLQKLVYYSQAWHLAWEEVPLFEERIEAWANGPVVPDLYAQHRGRFELHPGEICGCLDKLAANERETIDAVLDAYCNLNPYELSEKTHREKPWRDARARAGLAPGERGNEVISKEAMMEYYGALL